jgi:hypothetical protein
MVRDQALLASGQLVERVGGASVQESAKRRSVYTYRKRTAPPDDMLIFDAGSREVCQPKRLNTNTPLQALVLLNNSGFFESAKYLALRVSKTSGDPAAQIAEAFRQVCTRAPRPAELAALTELYAMQNLHGTQLASAPAPDLAPSKISSDPALAALTLVCSTILASDSAVTSR